MNKKVRFILKFILIVILGVMLMEGKAIAAGTKIDNFDQIKDQADSFVNYGKNNGSDYISADTLQDMVVPIAQTLVAIATVVVSVVTLVMGIKYLMAEPNDKAKLKQQLIGLVVSTIVIYGAQGIWALVYNFMTSVTQ